MLRPEGDRTMHGHVYITKEVDAGCYQPQKRFRKKYRNHK